MGFRVTPGAPTVAVPTMGTSGMTVTHVSCGFNSHRPPWGVSSLRRAPALQAGGGRGRADTLHQISPVAYARSIRSAENGESSVQLAGLAPSGNGVMRCIRALGARGLSSILSSPTKVFKRPCQRGLMAFATNEVYAGSNPAGRSISCAIVVTRS